MARPKPASPRSGSSAGEDNFHQYAAPALDKGLDILELLTQAQNSLSMAEIAQLLNRSVSEIFRMVVTLQRRGWISLDHDDRYGLSSKMFELAHRHRPIRSLVEVALPVMQTIARQTLNSCHLTIVEGGRILVICHVDAPGVRSFHVRTGSAVELHDTASGDVLLAFRSPEERARLIEDHAQITGKTLVLHKQWAAAIDSVARNGFACSASLQVRGVTDLGCPLWDRGRRVAGALIIPYLESLGPEQGVSCDEALEILRARCQDISRALGYQAPLPD